MALILEERDVLLLDHIARSKKLIKKIGLEDL